jgi:hypothetical protein
VKHRLWRYLLAILIGNLIYYSLLPYLPERARHQPFQIDWGLAVDFWFCLVCYGIIRLIR